MKTSKKQDKTKDIETKAESAMRGAWDNMMKAKEQSNIAKNASAGANRYCHEAKIIMEDTAKYRVESAESAEMAKKEAHAAALCGLWCTVGTILAILGAIISCLNNLKP